jgi:segregation and condensation protein A
MNVTDETAPLDARLQIDLPAFAGPLDLLLHLIQKHELEILDLPVAFVTEKYLAYLELMQELDLDVAAEYLLMAATLAHIKSKMLLPPDPNAAQQEGDGEEELDPRAELIRRLLEYQKYKAAAAELAARSVAGRDVFLRGADIPGDEGPAPLAELGLFALLDAFHAVLSRKHLDLVREISAERITIQERMAQITERLAGVTRLTFDELFEDVRTVPDVVVTFLALLEMAKSHLVRIYQADAGAPIHLESAVTRAEVDPTAEPGQNGEPT